MIVRRFIALGTIMIVFASVTGCDDVGWFGPDPEPTVDATCATSEVAAPPPYDPATGFRPPDVRFGNSWVLIELEVRALDPSGQDNEYCVPIGVHVYNRSGEADAVALGPDGVEPGPFDWVTTTPLYGRYVALQYDPTEERFSHTPPRYQIHLDATYLADRDTFNVQMPMALRCALRVRGNAIVAETALVTERSMVQCNFASNEHWNQF